MRKLGFLIVASLLLNGCSRRIEQPIKTLPIIGRIDVNVAGKPSVLDLKSGLTRVTARESSDPGYNYARYGFTLGNFDLTDNKALKRALEDETAVIVFFEILGPTGSNEGTPLAVGTYSTEAKGLPKFENLSLSVFTFVNHTQTWTLSRVTPAYETKGEVKITAIEGDLVKGEINVTTGTALAAKGTFVAQRAFDKPGFEAPK